MRSFLIRYTGICLLTVLCFGSQAQTETEDIYQLAQESGNLGFDQLLDQVDARLDDKTDIALFFYYWLARHIEYDTAPRATPFETPLDHEAAEPLNVFTLRKATCTGFTNLYNAFLTYFEIPHQTVIGYSKHQQNLLKRAKPALDHAWSAIWLNDRWHLVETTWANLYIDTPNMRDHYFMTPPDQMIVDHLPAEEQWQLTERLMNLEEFTTQTYVDAKYFAYARQASLLPGLNKGEEGHLVLTTSVMPGWKLSLQLVDANNEPVKKLKYKAKRSKESFLFQLKNYEPGYTLRLDASKAFIDGREITMPGIAYLNEETIQSTGSVRYASTISKPERKR